MQIPPPPPKVYRIVFDTKAGQAGTFLMGENSFDRATSNRVDSTVGDDR